MFINPLLVRPLLFIVGLLLTATVAMFAVGYRFLGLLVEPLLLLIPLLCGDNKGRVKSTLRPRIRPLV